MTAIQVIDRPPTTLPEFWGRHATVALELAGAEQSAWNGRIVEATDGVLGLADWDGTLHLDREYILEPLAELYAGPGEQRPKRELIRYREALTTLLHEQAHLLGPAGSSQRKARRAFAKPGARELEEGVTEAWALAHLDEYIQRLGIDQVAPGLLSVRGCEHYPAFVPAVRVLTANLDHRIGLPAGSTLDALNRETAEGQWPLVSELVYGSSRLPEVVPAREAPAVRLHFETLLRDAFSRLAVLELHPSDFAANRSQAYTDMQLDYLDAQLAAAEHHYAVTTHRHRPNPTHRNQRAFSPADFSSQSTVTGVPAPAGPARTDNHRPSPGSISIARSGSTPAARAVGPPPRNPRAAGWCR